MKIHLPINRFVFRNLLLVMLGGLCLVTSKAAAATFTAKASGDWTGGLAVWDVSNGTDADNIPDADDTVIIPVGITVSLTGESLCQTLILEVGGTILFNNFGFDFTSAFRRNASGDEVLFVSNPIPDKNNIGNWNSPNNWINKGSPNSSNNVYISTVFNLQVPGALNNTVIISPEGRLEPKNDISFGGTNTLYVDGIIQASSAINFTGNRILAGSGIINSTGPINLGGRRITVASGADITLQPSTVTGGGGIIDNNGRLTFDAAITGTTLNNLSNAYVKFQKRVVGGTGNLVLVASSLGNTVEYAFTDFAATVLQTTYHHLVLSTAAGTGSTIASNLTVNGNFTINGPTTLGSSVVLTLNGNWAQHHSNVTVTGSRVVFGSSAVQSISSTATSRVVFHALWVNKTGGIINSDKHILVTSGLNLVAGNINLGDKRLTVGTAHNAAGTVEWTPTGGYIIGEYEKFFPSNVLYEQQFPVGTPSMDTRLTFTFLSNTGGSVIVKFVETAPGTTGLPVTLGTGYSMNNTFSEGYWRVTAANGFSTSSYNSVARVNNFTSFPLATSTDARILLRSPTGPNPTHWTSGGQSSGNANPNPLKSVSASLLATTLSSSHPNLHLAIGSPLMCNVANAEEIFGTESICTNATSEYYVNQVSTSGKSDFKWTITGGGRITAYLNSLGGREELNHPGVTELSGQGLRFIEVTWPSSGSTSTAVTVSERAFGCGYGAPKTKKVDVNAVPPVKIEGRTTVAKGAKNVIYSIVGRPGYTYTWAVTNGTIVKTSPDFTTVEITWGQATGPQRVSVTAHSGSCTAAPPVNLTVTVFNVIDSFSTGDWDAGGGPNTEGKHWVGGYIPSSSENARINLGHIIRLEATNKEIRHLIIENGGTLNLNGNTINVTGNLEIYGSITGTGTINLTGLNTLIIGNSSTIGTPALPVTFRINNQKSVYAGSNFTITGNIDIASSATLTNNGRIILAGNGSTTGNITAVDNSSVWTNGSGSATTPTLISVAGTIMPTLGVLQASASYNTVEYAGTASVEMPIKTPENATYCNLTVSTTGTNLRTVSGSNIDKLNIKGDFIVTGRMGFKNFASEVIEFNGDVPQNINTSGTLQIIGESTIGTPSLIINNGNGINLLSNLTIHGSRSLHLTNGIITTGNNLLVVMNTAAGIVADGRSTGGAIIGGSENSFVNGRLRRVIPLRSLTDQEEFIFPVGRVSSQNVYAPAAILSSSTSTEYTVEYFLAPSPDSKNMRSGATEIAVQGKSYVSGVEYWNITPLNTAARARTKLYWRNSARSGITHPAPNGIQDLFVAHHNVGNPGNWNFIPSAFTVSGNTGSVTVEGAGGDGLTGFSFFSFGSLNLDNFLINPLPVTLSSFTGKATGGQVELTWTTVSEKNNSHFMVERRDETGAFMEIGRVEGNGNSSTRIDYSLADTQPYQGINYYRLKQVDYDGAFEYSKVISVNASLASVALNVYPNPTQDTKVTVSYQGAAAEKLQVGLFDHTGKLVKQYAPEARDGGFELQLPESLGTGIYYLKISASDRAIGSAKIIKK